MNDYDIIFLLTRSASATIEQALSNVSHKSKRLELLAIAIGECGHALKQLRGHRDRDTWMHKTKALNAALYKELE